MAKKSNPFLTGGWVQTASDNGTVNYVAAGYTGLKQNASYNAETGHAIIWGENGDVVWSNEPPKQNLLRRVLGKKPGVSNATDYSGSPFSAVVSGGAPLAPGESLPADQALKNAVKPEKVKTVSRDAESGSQSIPGGNSSAGAPPITYGSNTQPVSTVSNNGSSISGAASDAFSPHTPADKPVANPPAYHGAAPVVEVEHPQPGITITTTASGAEVEQVAGQKPYNIKPAPLTEAGMQKGISAFEEANEHPMPVTPAAPPAYHGGAPVVDVEHPAPGITITTTASGAQVEQVAGHTPYQIKAPNNTPTEIITPGEIAPRGKAVIVEDAPLPAVPPPAISAPAPAPALSQPVPTPAAPAPAMPAIPRNGPAVIPELVNNPAPAVAAPTAPTLLDPPHGSLPSTAGLTGAFSGQADTPAPKPSSADPAPMAVRNGPFRAM